MLQELRRQADDQPDKEKLLWKRCLSQQADYRAEIHELHTELLNMREKLEMKSHLAANMCRIEQTVPSRTVEAEPDNVLNTLSPGRNSRWILPSELETPDRPTSSGLQSPVGAPVQFGPSPLTREYSATPPGHIPPAQWGEFYGRAGDDGCELFGSVPNDDKAEEPCPQPAVHQPDELHDVRSPVAPLQQAPLVAARCVNGTLLHPGNAEEDQPSTACQQSEVCAPGGVFLGRGTPGQQQSPGGLRGRNINPPPPPPPPPPPVPHASAAPSTARYPLQWTPLHTRPKASGGGDPPGGPPNQGSGSASQWSLPGGHPSGGGQEEALGQEEQDHLHQEKDQEEEPPVHKTVCQVQSVVSQASIPDPADLDMDYGCEEPDLFRQSAGMPMPLGAGFAKILQAAQIDRRSGQGC